MAASTKQQELPILSTSPSETKVDVNQNSHELRTSVHILAAQIDALGKLFQDFEEIKKNATALEPESKRKVEIFLDKLAKNIKIIQTQIMKLLIFTAERKHIDFLRAINTAEANIERLGTKFEDDLKNLKVKQQVLEGQIKTIKDQSKENIIAAITPLISDMALNLETSKVYMNGLNEFCPQTEDDKGLPSTRVRTPIPMSDLRVLIVEDQPLNQKILISVLKNIKCQWGTASNGVEAVAAYKEAYKSDDKSKKYHIILMDIQMPIMDGYKATEEIRAFEETECLGDRIPIIAVTANHNAKEDVIKAGMDDCICKPCKPAYIAKVLTDFSNTGELRLSNSPTSSSTASSTSLGTTASVISELTSAIASKKQGEVIAAVSPSASTALPTSTSAMTTATAATMVTPVPLRYSFAANPNLTPSPLALDADHFPSPDTASRLLASLADGNQSDVSLTPSGTVASH